MAKQPATRECFYSPTHQADYRLTYNMPQVGHNTNYYLCESHKDSFSTTNLIKVTPLRGR